MNRNLIAQAAVLFGIFLSAASRGADVPAKPNILFFLIDDLGFADCGFNGGKDILTPNIDRLAKGGTVIESHYVQPVCSPTRAALMTGRYATHTGVYTIVTPHAQWGLPLKERTLANALKEEGYTTHLLRDEACRIIEKQPADKPLFLYVPFNGIHSPHQVPEEYLKPYANLAGSRQKIAGMLSAVDEAVGKITETLGKTGRGSNTLIVFSSDNGGPPATDNTPLTGFKGSLWEGGVRAAAFAHWPGKIPAGARTSEPVHIIDWYPTLVKLAGGSPSQPNAIDGLDIWPTLTQGKPSPHDAILSVSSPTAAALRMGDWKLLMSPADNRKREDGTAAKGKQRVGNMPAPGLYNLAADPGEKTDLAGREPERVQTMRAKLEALLQNAAAPGNAGLEK
jgi:arylsulfatase A-like enzyme